MFSKLDSAAIVATLERLEQRIGARFPDSGLRRVAGELLRVARQLERDVEHLGGPVWWVRALGFVAIVGLAILAWGAVSTALRLSHKAPSVAEFLQALDAGVNEFLLLGAAIYFFLSLEGRLKRRKALHTLHQLRSVAHVVDMHQMSKDPEDFVTRRLAADADGPPLTRDDLARYYDFCSELLSILSKLAALHAQYLNDPVVLNAVNDVESLAGTLSVKIWQKTMILDSIAARGAGAPAAAPVGAAPL